VKIADLHKSFIKALFSRYKLGEILDFRFWILELRNSVYYTLIERSDSRNPKSLRAGGRNPKSQIMTNNSIGINRDVFVKADSAFCHYP